MLTGKKILITGVRNRRSAAYWILENAIDQGADVVLTSLNPDRTEKVVKRLPVTPPIWELDVTDKDTILETKKKVEDRWGELDGLVHSIAYADRECIDSDFFKADREQIMEAFDISSFSIYTLAREFSPLMKERGSIVALSFETSQIWPPYGWMNFFKVALEYLIKMIAVQLGERGVRANVISAGTMKTLSARGIPGFSEMANKYEEAAPLEWDSRESQQFVADACVWLLSDLSKKVTGEVLHVDGGMNVKSSFTIEE